MDKNELNVKQAVPFFMVENMERALDFYTKGLDFKLTSKWEPRGKIEWCWLQFDSAAIMLQEYRNAVPIEKRGVGVSICLMCADALAIYERAIARGLSSVCEPFVGNNLWVVEMKDPDGYSIFFESPTEVPEETMLSQWKQQVNK
jgi:lactoylglutathione lyase